MLKRAYGLNTSLSGAETIDDWITTLNKRKNTDLTSVFFPGRGEATAFELSMSELAEWLIGRPDATWRQQLSDASVAQYAHNYQYWTPVFLHSGILNLHSRTTTPSL